MAEADELETWLRRYLSQLPLDQDVIGKLVADILRHALDTVSSPPAAGWKDSVAPSLGSSEARALMQLLNNIETELTRCHALALEVSEADHHNGWDAGWADGIRVGYRNALQIIKDERAASKAQDGSSLEASPDPVLSNGEKK